MKPYLAIIHYLKGFFGEGSHFNEPLLGKIGLHNDIGPFGVTDVVVVVLNFYKVATAFQIRDNFLPCLKTVQPCITELIRHLPIAPDNTDNRQVMTTGNVEVVRVMSRRYFKRTGAELDVHIIISNHRHMTTGNRHYGKFPDQVAVSRIIRVDCDRNVCKNGFRSHGCYGNILARLFGKRVTNIHKLIFPGLHDHLFIGKSRL